MKHRDSLEERYLDILLEQAAGELAEEKAREAERILAPFASLPPAVPSKDFVRGIKRRRRGERRPPSRWMRAAACLVLALGLGVGMLASDTHAFWQYFQYFVLQNRGDYSSLTLVDAEGENIARQAEAQGWEEFYMPTSLPKGLELTDSRVTKLSYTLRYEGEGMELSFSCLRAENLVMGADTEDARVITMEIHGKEAVYIEKGDRRSVYFHNDELVFRVMGTNIPKEILLDIAKSIRLQ